MCNFYYNNSLDQTPSCEANNRSASQTIPRLLRYTDIQYCMYSQQTAPGPNPEPDASSPHPLTQFV
jgi:hypothetical protein